MLICQHIYIITCPKKIECICKSTYTCYPLFHLLVFCWHLGVDIANSDRVKMEQFLLYPSGCSMELLCVISSWRADQYQSKCWWIAIKVLKSTRAFVCQTYPYKSQNETPNAPPEIEKTLWFANALPNASDSKRETSNVRFKRMSNVRFGPLRYIYIYIYIYI
jgi:hypothetical protein